MAVYVDITTVPEWREGEVTMVDLDLDVIQSRDGSVFVDDEDEFVVHRDRYGYPAEIIEMAQRACTTVCSALRAGDEPFGLVGHSWLMRFQLRHADFA